MIFMNFFSLVVNGKVTDFSIQEMFVGEKIEWEMWKDDFGEISYFFDRMVSQNGAPFFEYFYMFTKSDHKSFDEWFRFELFLYIFLWSFHLNKWLRMVQTHLNFLIKFFKYSFLFWYSAANLKHNTRINEMRAWKKWNHLSHQTNHSNSPKNPAVQFHSKLFTHNIWFIQWRSG